MWYTITMENKKNKSRNQTEYIRELEELCKSQKVEIATQKNAD